MRTLLILVVSLIVLGGCVASTGPIAGAGGDAEYRHPVTGDTRHCDNNTGQGFLWFGVIGAVAEGSRYADCKNALEGQGYVRFKPGSIILRHPGTGEVVDCAAQAEAANVQPAIAVNNCVATRQKLGYVPFAESFPAATQAERAIPAEPGKDCPTGFVLSQAGAWCLPQ